MYSLDSVEMLRPRPGAVVVECKGEHDLTTRDELAAVLAALGAENDLVVVDVTEAEFIDCSFLHNLVELDRLMRARGATMRLQTGTAPIVRRALEATRVLAGIEVVTSRRDALEE